MNNKTTDLKRKQPLWQNVKEELRKQIDNSSFGERFYTLEEICRQFNVSQITARRAVAELRNDGLLQINRGRAHITKKLSGEIFINVIFPEEYSEKTWFQPVVFRIHSGIMDASKEFNIKVGLLSEKYLNGRYLSGGEKGGFVLMSGVKEPVKDFLRKNNLPFVILIDEDSPDPCIRVDKEYGAFLGVDHLISAGHKRIGCIMGPVKNIPFAPRFKGYLKALRKNNIEYDRNLLRETSGIDAAQDFKAFEELLRLPERPTAIFAGTDYRAIHVMEYCERKSIKIPESLSIVGFDNINESAYTSPPLTTVDTHREDVGKEAVRLLVYILANDGKIPARNVLLKPSLVIRKSTGTVKTKGGK